jgi:hypothetical protein
MRNFIAIYALVGSSMFSLAQTVTEPHGEGSVVFGRLEANGKRP